MSTSAAPRRDPRTSTWWFVVDLPPGADGQRRQAKRRGFATKKAAQEALDALRVSGRDGSFVELRRISFGEYLSEWLVSLAPRRRPTTVESYRRQINAHVLRHPIGAIQLQRLSPMQLDQLYAELLTSGRVDGRGGLSKRSVRFLHCIIHKALADALRKRIVTVNVADAADPPSARESRPPETIVWTMEQLQAFVRFAAAHELGALWRLYALTGIRRGEALGLRWRDIDWEHRRLSIAQQVVPIRGASVIGPAKTDGSERTVDVDTHTLAALRAHRAQQAATRLLMGEGYLDQDLVFAKPDGGPWFPPAITNRWARLVAKSGLPPIRLHDLRHTHASVMIAEGEPVKVVQERLGHTTPGYTMLKYQKVLPGMQAQAAERFARLVDGDA
jgi:integrase